MGKSKTAKALDAEKASGAEGPQPYRGKWTLDAKKVNSGIRLQDIRSFELVEGIWFMYHDDGLVTAVPISNWDYVQLEKDEES